MSEQLTVRMPKELAQKLAKAAKVLRRSRSDVVRLALERFLQDFSGAEEPLKPVDLVWDLLGRVESGVPDLGQRHREHLLERLRRSRA